MRLKSIIIRYFCFVIGLFFLSLGIDFIVTSALGTTPISSINYVLSLNTPMTLGTATFVFNMLVMAGQFWLVRGQGTHKDYIEIILQIPFSLIFSVFIDLNLQWITHIPISGYAISLLMLASGCMCQAIGVVLELKPNVAIMSAEGFVKYFCRRYHKDFGHTKVVFDISLVTGAILLSLLFCGHIEGIREGTVIAALCTGFMVNFLARYVFTRRNMQRAIPHGMTLYK